MANTPAPETARRPGGSFSIAEWAQHRRVSISYFYKLMDEGRAPQSIKVGRRRMITAEADAAWAGKQESAAAA
jgi:predicted DNA-binding transcriptional regulator AlpA